jgi:hypothetical protein
MLHNLYENNANSVLDIARAQRPIILQNLLTTCHSPGTIAIGVCCRCCRCLVASVHVLITNPALSVGQQTIKIGIKVLRRMCLCWKDDPEFQQFIVSQVIPLCFAIPFHVNFRLGDSESHQVCQRYALVCVCAHRFTDGVHCFGNTSCWVISRNCK